MRTFGRKRAVPTIATKSAAALFTAVLSDDEDDDVKHACFTKADGEDSDVSKPSGEENVEITNSRVNETVEEDEKKVEEEEKKVEEEEINVRENTPTPPTLTQPMTQPADPEQQSTISHHSAPSSPLTESIISPPSSPPHAIIDQDTQKTVSWKHIILSYCHKNKFTNNITFGVFLTI